MRKALQPRLVVEYLTIDDLKLDPRNPRKHDKPQTRQIGNSIKSFGFNVPILVDRNNKVLAGHGRVLAAKEIGLTQLPIIRLEWLDEEQARAFAIADNKLCENAAWDDQLLGEIFCELAKLDLNFSLEDTGFFMAEIDLRIEGLSIAVDPASDPADDLSSLSSGTPVSKLGDLWQLGSHGVLCGNTLEEGSFTALMQGQLAQMCFIDPPYNVKINGHVGGKGRIKPREFAMASGEMSMDGFTQFLRNSFQQLLRHSSDGSIHFVCMDWRHQLEILTAGNQIYSELLNLAVWVKNNGGMGSFLRSRHELIYIFANGTGKRRNNVQLGKFGRNRTNVWEYPNAATMSKSGDEGNLLSLHPTVKPVQMIADAILDCTARGDIVLDSFLGSGSTLIAAERVGRTCYAVELDPLYVDTAIRRWQKLTGGQAIHADTGKSFDQLEQERGEQRPLVRRRLITAT